MNTKLVEKLASVTNCSFKGLNTIDGVKSAYGKKCSSDYEFAKGLYYLSKVEGLKNVAIADKVGCSEKNIGKHVNNIEWLIDTFGSGIDDTAELYKISIVDLARKCKDAGCYKDIKNPADLLSKKRSDMERALKNKKSGSTSDDNATTSNDSTSDDNTIEVIEIFGKLIPVDTWNNLEESIKALFGNDWDNFEDAE